MPSELDILRSKSLTKVVQGEILRLIIEGEFHAGEKLVEATLAARLRVSRGPVREALCGLEEAGLVRVTKNRGVFVRELNVDEATELYEMRAVLDEMAGKLLVERVSDAYIEELRTLVDDMECNISSGDMNAYYPKNFFFHDRMVEMAGNKKLLETYRRLMNEMHLLRRRGLTRGGGIFVSNDEHRAVIDALASRDETRVGIAMRSHVLAGRDRYLASLGESGQATPHARTEVKP